MVPPNSRRLWSAGAQRALYNDYILKKVIGSQANMTIDYNQVEKVNISEQGVNYIVHEGHLP